MTGHEAIGLALARDLGAPASPADMVRLRELGARMPRDVTPEGELRAVAALLVGPLRADRRGPLLLPAALWGAAHPIGTAVAAAAVAARAGYGVDLVGHREALYLAHPEAAPLVVDPRGGEVVDGRELGVTLAWRCAHEAAACLLDRVVARGEREGDIALALAGAALRVALPLDEDGRRRHEREHRRLLARLN